MGGRAQQRVQPDRREQPSLLWPGAGSESDSAQASVDRGDCRAASDYQHLLRDNYETPFYAPELGGSEVELQQLEKMLKLSVDDFKAHARTLSSPDELSVYIARQLMRQVAPSLLWITMHDIDIAHAGAYSLYIDGIRRTDRLCAEIWKAIQSEPEYAGNTTMFILPDFGRDSDDDSGGNGFQHHRTGDALSRTTWMMALGAGVRQGVVFDRADGVDRSGADSRVDAGFFGLARAGQADIRNCCSAYASKRSQAGAVQGLSARGEKAGHGLCWSAATVAAELLCPACCGRSSTTISSFLRSARRSRRNWRT